MFQADDGVLPLHRPKARSQKAAIQKIRSSCLGIEQGLGRPIDLLNDMQRALDELYESEWARRKRQG